MAIIPLGLCTIPPMRKVSMIRPAFPGGRFSGGALVAVAFVSSVSKGSRRTACFSGAGFSTGGFVGFAAAALVVPFESAGTCAEALAGAFAGAFAFAPEGLALAGAAL